MDPSATVLPPPEVPGLTDLTVLARGGYATVYRAVQASVGREVAVKVENRTLENERDQRRFLREARAAGRMSSHPHVVDLFDAGVTADGHPYLIMELCDGSYADRIRTVLLTAAETREVGMKIADALADAHTLGVLHRDVKPANILISRFGEPALADFGLAVLAETRDTSITLEVLTPAYAPREMFRAGTPPSPAADVYSLCATLYALLRGRPPRWRDERNPSLITLMDLFDQPVPDLPGVPASLLDVLRTGMVNDPGARPTAAVLRDRLAALALPGSATVPPAPGEGPRVVAGAGGGVPGRYRTPALDAVTVAMPVATPAQRPPAQRPPVQGPPVQGPPPPAASPPAAPPQALPVSGRPVAGSPGPGPATGRHPGHPVPLPPPGQPTRPVRGAVAAFAPPGRGAHPGATMPHRHWRPYAGLGAAVLVFGLLVGGATWYGLAHRAPRPAPSSPAAVRTSAGARNAGAAGGGGGSPRASRGGCAITLVGGSCPAAATCYGKLTISHGVASAKTTPCRSTHTWEVFALGTLPREVRTVDYETVKGNDTVRGLCNPITLGIISVETMTWQIDVLPPTPKAFAAGDRTFRCLAGNGPDSLHQPVFAR